MLLLIFFQIVFAQIQEIDCDLINKLLERSNMFISISIEYEIKQPIILLFYFKYGAIYQQIKSPWLQYSKNYTQYEFMQLDMKEYSEQCIVGIFEHNYLPYGIYINDKFEYHAELIRESGQLIEYLEQTKQFEFAPLPKFNKYRKLQNMLTNYIFVISPLNLDPKHKGDRCCSINNFAIWFRLQIYKDKDKSE